MLDKYPLQKKDQEYIKYNLYYYKYLVNRKFCDLVRCRRAYIKSLNSISDYSIIDASKTIYRMIRVAYKVK